VGLIRKVRQDGVTVFPTPHCIEEAEFLADRAAFVHQGRLAGQGAPSEPMAAPGAWAVDRFGDAGVETRWRERTMVRGRPRPQCEPEARVPPPLSSSGVVATTVTVTQQSVILYTPIGRIRKPLQIASLRSSQ
jgi:ABC-type proline/glycine betaine transport system ATPase subunit